MQRRACMYAMARAASMLKLSRRRHGNGCVASGLEM